MKHSNAIVLEKFYSDLSSANWEHALAVCGDSVTFQISGKSRLAGKFNKKTVTNDLWLKFREFSGGTFKIEVHDILAGDLHATVLASCSLLRNGSPIEYRTVHVWRFAEGLPIAWYEYPRDLYQFDAIWG